MVRECSSSYSTSSAWKLIGARVLVCDARSANAVAAPVSHRPSSTAAVRRITCPAVRLRPDRQSSLIAPEPIPHQPWFATQQYRLRSAASPVFKMEEHGNPKDDGDPGRRPRSKRHRQFRRQSKGKDDVRDEVQDEPGGDAANDHPSYAAAPLHPQAER